MKKGNQPGKRNLNFRETHSERSATASYRNFGAEASRARLRAKARQAWDSARALIGKGNK